MLTDQLIAGTRAAPLDIPSVRLGDRAYRMVAPLKVLLVEDSPGDAVLTRLALDACDMPYTLEQLVRGTDVIPYLTRRGVFADAPTPDLMLLDLGLPYQDGFEVLAELAEMPASARGFPIAILTGYEHFEYLKKTYDLLCVSDYLTKPCSPEKLRSLLLRAAWHA